MAVPTKIQHPLLRLPGTSQRKRIAGSQLLRPDLAPIDGRKLGDMLDFVYEYARLVVFHEYKIDAAGQKYVELSNWLGFFENSLPYALNQFAKSDFDRLQTELQSTIEAIEQKPNDASLFLLLDFCYFDLIQPLVRLQQTARKFDFEPLVTLLDRTTRTSLLPHLRRFIELSNVAAKYFCKTKYDFMVFAQAPWDIPIEDLFVIDETVEDVPGGQAGAIKWLGVQLADVAQRFIVVQRNIAQEIPSFLEESIDVLKKRNDPHLGLLYVFLRLFEHFQSELNGLTQKHIEFFYSEVLQLKGRDMLPDQVHLLFEPAKHLDSSHRIKQGTVFKDAKDSKNVDILFDLDEEIVIDKAKVVALQTLYLNHNQGCLEGNVSNNMPSAFVEGVYIAPVANSADGKGGEFKEEQSKNWATLGAKLSKYTAPGEIVRQNHPFGRIGFILASPVLWLNEGQREVTITIECDASKNEDWYNACFKQELGEFSETKIYKITDKTIQNVEALFSIQARGFLHEEFTKRSPLQLFTEEEWTAFLEQPNTHFTKHERDILADLLKKTDAGVYILEMLSSTLLKKLSESAQVFLQEEFAKSSLPLQFSTETEWTNFLQQPKTRFTKQEQQLLANLVQKTNGGVYVLGKLPPESLVKFSEPAQTFLQKKFAKNSPLQFSTETDWTNFLQQIEKRFTIQEQELVADLVQKVDGGVYVLKEVPFKSLLQQLRLQKDRKFIGSAALSHFFQTTSCSSGGSLVPDTLHEMIQGFFNEEPNKIVLDRSEYFTVHFSGEKGWFQVSNKTDGQRVFLIAASGLSDKTFTLRFEAKLSVEDPKVAFYSEKTIGETFETEFAFPMVRIELKSEIQFPCNNFDITSGCCLETKNKPNTLPIGLYYLLRFLTIVKTDIDVKVGGLKNLVVQNEESLQDVNSVVLPFGSRPKLKADFLIGSKELLCKDWKRFQIGIEWKGKPDSLAEHYTDYGKKLKLEIEPPRDRDNKITDDLFEIEPAIMQSGGWTDHDRFKLFTNGPDANNRFTYPFERKATYEFKTFDSAPLEPFTVNTRDAFLRWRLRGASFQHAVYPFALATYLLEFTKQIPSGFTVPTLIKRIDEASVLVELICGKVVHVKKDTLDSLKKALKNIQTNISNILTTAITQVQDHLTEADKKLTKVPLSVSGTRDEITQAMELINRGVRQALVDLEGVLGTILTTNIVGIETELGEIKTHLESGDELQVELLTNEVEKIEDKVKSLKTSLETMQTNLSSILTTELTQVSTHLATAEKILNDLLEGIEISLDDQFNAILKTNIAEIETELGVIETDLGRDGALQKKLKELKDSLDFDVKLPNEPYTPQVKSICIDYVASAKTEDIEFIHLYPFAKTSKTETLFIVETLQKYQLSLRSISVPSDLPDQGESLIIVALDNAKLLHIRIFDDKGQRIVDKVEAELNKGQKLTELKKFLQPFPDQSTLTEDKKPEIIDKAISISISQTTLLPTFTDEGTLFIGLEGLRPRSNLQLLFQFAEATADSETGRACIKWNYLAKNQWKELRTGFELLSDKTEQMTRSGIVKIALPEDISNEGNTLMPPTKEGQHLFWLKVSTPSAVVGVAELLGVHAQAALATYKPLAGSDLDRVAKTVEPEQIGKTLEPDFGIKKIQQPYKSFGGSVAEAKGTIPIRMSELLRHKGRSVDAFDIEHLVLDAFPELFKCKCISHTMGLSARQYQRDLEVAPGFLIVAVVPDLTKLEPGDMLQPMAPVSTLTKVKKFLMTRVSPFARIRVMNPRYEKVHLRVEVQLRRGRDKNYYLSQLKTDLCHFLAPWHLGDSDKLSFGQHLVFSDVLGFIEGLEYIDFVTDLRMFNFKLKNSKEIVPLTARSILSPGDIKTFSYEKDYKEKSASQPDENKLAAFLKSASPITCGEAQSDLSKETTTDSDEDAR
ncbi:MAG: hypothetical protein NTV43_14270 [Methylococcales bacterium]|nr:hypothetical protein [Methylococcales bacterium]